MGDATPRRLAAWLFLLLAGISVVSSAVEYFNSAALPYQQAEAVADQVSTRGTDEYEKLRAELTHSLLRGSNTLMGLRMALHAVVAAVSATGVALIWRTPRGERP